MKRPIPVLMYHHVNPNKGDMVTVTPETFEGQMSFLKRAGYTSISIRELEQYLSGTLILRERAVVITFDDGWLDNYVYALPVLARYGIKATVFTVTDWIEGATAANRNSHRAQGGIPAHSRAKSLIKSGRFSGVIMNWGDVRAMMETGLVDFYSHTKTHPACHNLTDEVLETELKGSRDAIENRLGRPCPYLCWPYGKYSESAINIAKDLGYRAIFTTRHGVAKPGTDPLRIPRIVVKDKVQWFRIRMLIYTHPLLAKAYLGVKKA